MFSSRRVWSIVSSCPKGNVDWCIRCCWKPRALFPAVPSLVCRIITSALSRIIHKNACILRCSSPACSQLCPLMCAQIPLEVGFCNQEVKTWGSRACEDPWLLTDIRMCVTSPNQKAHLQFCECLVPYARLFADKLLLPSLLGWICNAIEPAPAQ